jgi:hypothetical protein
MNDLSRHMSEHDRVLTRLVAESVLVLLERLIDGEWLDLKGQYKQRSSGR